MCLSILEREGQIGIRPSRKYKKFIQDRKILVTVASEIQNYQPELGSMCQRVAFANTTQTDQIGLLYKL